MPLDSEEENMLATCRILQRRLDVAEERLIARLEKDPARNSPTRYLKHEDGEALVDCWRRITNNGTDEAEAARGER